METLTGHDHRIDQAEPIALDYAGEPTAFGAGGRESDPLPRPQIVTATQRAA